MGTIAAMKAAGLALARERRTRAALAIDAIVMATAALHDAAVVTSDVDDLTRLKAHFPGVVILSV